MEWDIATLMCALTAWLIPLYCVKFREIRSSSFWVSLKWGIKWKLCCDLCEISRFSFIWHTGVLKRIRISQFWFQLVNRQSFLHILWKFVKIWISYPRVLGERSAAKLWQNNLPPALIALSFRNGMGSCYLNELINSVNDILCENFVKFGPVVFELA